jgi:hypothetical protein
MEEISHLIIRASPSRMIPYSTYTRTDVELKLKLLCMLSDNHLNIPPSKNMSFK